MARVSSIFLFLAMAVWLLYPAAAAATDPMLSGAESVVASDVLDQRRPKVAFDGSRYLVVWEDNRSGAFEIWGRFYARSGVPDGSEFIITGTSNATDSRPELSFNGTRYLVTWGDMSGAGGTETDIYGRFVETDGTVGAAFAICTAAGFQQKSYIETDGSNFLVVWMDGRDQGNNRFDVYGRFVSASGVLGPETGIAVGVGSAERPEIKFNGTRYLVVWNDSRDPFNFGVDNFSFNIWGRTIDSSGNLGGEIVISGATGEQTHPHVDFDGTNYLVVWRDFRNDPSGIQAEIYGQRLNSIDQVTPLLNGGEVAISTAPASDKYPHSLIYNRDKRYFLVYSSGFNNNTTTGNVYGRFLKQAGDAYGPEIVVSQDPSRRARAAFDGENFLVVWAALGSDDDVHAQLVKDVVSITTASLPDGAAGAAYSASLSATGGVEPYTWGFDPSNPGTLPPGLSLSSSGVLSGTPTVAGTYTFRPRVYDSYFSYISKDYTVTINSGTVTNVNVTLSFPPNEPGFTTDGLNPDTGDPATVFEFKVVYTSANNTPPQYMNVCIDNQCWPMWDDGWISGVSGSGARKPGLLFDGQYSNGEQYVWRGSLTVGTHTYKFRAFDGAEYGKLPYSGSLSGPTVSSAPPADVTPPQTQWNVSYDNSSPPNKVLRLGAADEDVSNPGTYSINTVREINYSIDGGALVTVPGAEAFITFSNEGSYDVSYYAVDTSGNAESAQQVNVTLDRTPPVITAVDGSITLPQGALYADWHDLLQFVSATDNLSGVQLLYPSLSQFYPGFYPYLAWVAVDFESNTAVEHNNITINTQSTVYGLQLAGGTTAQISVNGQTLSNVSATTAGPPPPGVLFPVGAISYSVTSPSGGQVTTTFTFTPAISGPIDLYKVNGGGQITPLPPSDWTASTVGSSTVITLTLADNGPYDLDPALGMIEDPVAVGIIVNAPPVASVGSDRNVFTGETIAFDGAGSSDPEGASLSYSWAIDSAPSGSAAVLSGADTVSPTLVPDVDGQYIVSLVVNDGVISSAPDTVLVNATMNMPPVVTLSASTLTGVAPVTVSFDASGSYDPEGGALSYSWDFGDPSSGPENTSTGESTVHTYATAGSYSAVVKIKDAFGNIESASVVVEVTAPNMPPSVSPIGSPASGTIPLVVNFQSNASDPEGGALSYSWEFGDGATSSEADPMHVYYVPGAYQARVTVSDGEHSVTGTVTVSVDSALSINVTDAKADLGGRGNVIGKLNIKASYDYRGTLVPSDVIRVVFGGITEFEGTFGNFTASEDEPGVYERKDDNLHVKIDTSSGMIKLTRHKTVLSSIDNSNGVEVAITFGYSTGVDRIFMEEKRNSGRLEELTYKEHY